MFIEIPRRYADGSRDAIPQLMVFEKVSNQSFLAKDIQIPANWISEWEYNHVCRKIGNKRIQVGAII